VLVGSKRYNLIDVEQPTEGDFIQLETITENKSYSRAIYIVQLNEEKPQIKIGRGHDSDLKIEDISVSRVHALIKLTSTGYVLEDNSSKFGTLYLLPPGSHEIPVTNGLFIQYGRTTLGLTVKEPESEVKKGLASAYQIVPETCTSIM
jgi:pSer/pThr/pTyr-binding forkhead associated (FHA) protein